MSHSRGSMLKLVNNTLLRNGVIYKPIGTKKNALAKLEEYIATKTEDMNEED